MLQTLLDPLFLTERPLRVRLVSEATKEPIVEDTAP
jgi:hypothetical protein